MLPLSVLILWIAIAFVGKAIWMEILTYMAVWKLFATLFTNVIFIFLFYFIFFFFYFCYKVVQKKNLNFSFVKLNLFLFVRFSQFFFAIYLFLFYCAQLLDGEFICKWSLRHSLSLSLSLSHARTSYLKVCVCVFQHLFFLPSFFLNCLCFFLFLCLLLPSSILLTTHLILVQY